MNPQESPSSSFWQLFEQLVDLELDQRERLLQAETALDPADRRRLEAMLAISGEAEQRLAEVIGAGLRRLDSDALGDEKTQGSRAESTEIGGRFREAAAFRDRAAFRNEAEAPLPRELGPYRVLREIGRGGLSTVYLAERQEPQMQVAIKVVRPDMASDEMQERLRRERQILADLDHANIARIFDGGTAENRAPYFVMEYIDGRHIDEYCEAEQLTAPKRLELFLKVAAAVDYAHRKLVLHRDLKPSNILVTENGTPKLLDFGIAKLLLRTEQETPTAELTLTRPGMQVFTPDYASPEQILGESLTTASDIYSLGVVLYQLVAGQRPHSFAAYNAIEMAKVATGPEPPPPSSHGRSRADDLDTIILMALRKDPERRYGSVAQLAEDVKRYLRGDVVSARKDTFGYRAAKFIRRHKLAVASAALIFITLFAAVILTSWQAREAREARKRAEENLGVAELQRARAENVVGFLTRLFEVSDPYEARGRTISAREVLDQGSDRIRRELKDDPDLRADLMAVMGRVYRSLSLYSEAENLTEEALELLSDHAGPEAPPVIALRRDLAKIVGDRGDCTSAARMLHDIVSLETSRDPTGAGLAETLQELGEAEAECDHHEAAEKTLGRALSLRRELFGELSSEALETEHRRAQLWLTRGSYDLAIEGLTRVIDLRRQVMGEDHLAVVEARNDLALALHYNGRLEEAAEIYGEALEQQRRLLGEDHSQIATTLYNLAVLRQDQANLEAARTLFGEALEKFRRAFGKGHPLEADCLQELARLARRRGELTEAERLLREALDIRLVFFGPESPEAAKSGLGLANLLAETDPAAAKDAYLANIELHDRVLGRTDHRTSYPRLRLAGLLLRLREPSKAETYTREVIEIRRAALPQGHHEIALAQGYLGQSLADQGRFKEAIAVLQSSYDGFAASLGEDDPKTIRAGQRLASVLDRAEQESS